MEKKRAAKLTEPERWTHGWIPFALIALGSALAHGWCLGSQFYLDDQPQIRDNEFLREGEWYALPFKQWTYLCYAVQMKVFGPGAMGFHAVNWLLHTAVAWVLFASGRTYLQGEGAAGTALVAALLFVSHPLGSEIPNYARTQDLAWVTLFSLLAAWFVVRAVAGEGRSWWLASAVCIGLATISKGPGFFHAVMMAALAGLVFRPEGSGAALWTRIKSPAGLGAVVLLVALLVGASMLWWDRLPRSFSDPRIGWHALTLCRVFWEFVARLVPPFRLSADHQVGETIGLGDTAAWWAVAGVGFWIALGVALTFRREWRPIGAGLLLFVGAIVLRMGFYNSEYMPEYRIYPGLPWIFLAGAALLTKLWGRPGYSLPAVVGVLVLGLALSSAQRSFQWHRIETLTEDVLQQYPAQARALWFLQYHDAENGRWEAVIERHQRLDAVLQQFLKYNKEHEGTRTLSPGHFGTAFIGCRSLYARALAEKRGVRAGLAELQAIERFLTARKIDHKLTWSFYYHELAMVLELAGEHEAARGALIKSGARNAWALDLKRVEAKLRDGRGSAEKEAAAPK